MAKVISFQPDIRTLFTEKDIHAMGKALDLGSYNDVKGHAAVIYDRIRGSVGPLCHLPHREETVLGRNLRFELFAKWMADGYQP